MTITESYAGIEIEPIKILETEYGKIYIGLAKYEHREQYVVYGNGGSGALDLSCINPIEFEEALEINKKLKEGKSCIY